MSRYHVYTIEDVLAHLRKYDPDFGKYDPDFSEDLWRDVLSRISREWVLRQIPIDRFRLYPADGLKRTESYAKLETQAPAIIAHLDGGLYSTLDGEHRLHNAKARGDASILAFVPEAQS